MALGDAELILRNPAFPSDWDIYFGSALADLARSLGLASRERARFG